MHPIMPESCNHAGAGLQGACMWFSGPLRITKELTNIQASMSNVLFAAMYDCRKSTAEYETSGCICSYMHDFT